MRPPRGCIHNPALARVGLCPRNAAHGFLPRQAFELTRQPRRGKPAGVQTNELIQLGVPLGEPMRRATDFICAYCLRGGDRTRLAAEVAAVVRSPSDFLADPLRGSFAKALQSAPPPLRAQPAGFRQWGENLEPEAVLQMQKACLIPVAVAGALMPDAHPGYGLPIGGVLATEKAVLPYAVGVDIACRMKLSVLDLPPKTLDKKRDRLARILEEETRFGGGAIFEERRQHPVMDEDWSASPVTRQCKDRAWSQLGTSGSGNHFVEFGRFVLPEPLPGLPAGEHVAILSHSGSRAAGAMVCGHYSQLAFDRHPELPRELLRLAWLDLASAEGQEYWAAMELLGRYAAANHELIHRGLAEKLGAQVLLEVENHHNFAWKEIHGGREVVVHRKGATPAGAGVLGIIPGSMAAPGFLVRGRGNAESLASAAHGAGRLLSRAQAAHTMSWKKANKLLRELDVTLLSAGLDEVPMVYKDIHQVMASQSDLVEILGRFEPKVVKMCPDDTPDEDSPRPGDGEI